MLIIIFLLIALNKTKLKKKYTYARINNI